MKNILDLTKELNFVKEIELPISKKVVNIKPLTVKEAQGLSVNGIESLVKSKFTSKKNFEKNYKNFQDILDNTILTVSNFETKSELSQLCFLDYIYLFSVIRNNSEGEDSLILNKKCENILSKEVINKETKQEKIKYCDHLLTFELTLEDEDFLNIQIKEKEDYTIKLNNVDYIFTVEKLNFHNFMKLTLLTFNLEQSPEFQSEIFTCFIDIIFSTLDKIKVKVNNQEYDYKIIKKIKLDNSEKLADDEIDIETFRELISNKLPGWVTGKLIKNILEKQPQLKKQVEITCPECSFVNSKEVTAFDFFTLF